MVRAMKFIDFEKAVHEWLENISQQDSHFAQYAYDVIKDSKPWLIVLYNDGFSPEDAAWMSVFTSDLWPEDYAIMRQKKIREKYVIKTSKT